MGEAPAADRLRENRIRYDRMARYYTRVMGVTFLGQVGRLYRAVAALSLRPESQDDLPLSAFLLRRARGGQSPRPD